MAIDPCRICGEPARMETREGTKRLGEAKGEMVETRVCTSAKCPSRTGQRRLGDAV